MDGGDVPIEDGALVLCAWNTVSNPSDVEGQPVLLTGTAGDDTVAYLKIPVRKDGRWFLRSSNPTVEDQSIDANVTLRVVARVLEVVDERRGPVLWGLYDRDSIAELFGQENNPSWKTGHRDVDMEGNPQTVLMVNLRKPKGTPLEHRYADRFISSSKFQWESQASSTVSGAKGQRIIHHKRDQRAIHLFVRYHTKDAGGSAEPLTYCGTLDYKRHEDEQPIRVWFDLNTPLPDGLWRSWSEL